MEGLSFLEILLLGFKFFGGFGMFLYGMHVMSDGLQKSTGGKMKNMLDSATSNRLKAVGVGATITAVVQSSSATSVMVVGFVNASLLTLNQAVGVIMGANIGTTITSWIVSSSEWFKVLKPSQIAPLAIGIGAIMLFFLKSKKNAIVAEILVGFGMLFIGLEFMKEAIDPFSEAEAFKNAFLMLGSNPLFGILAGAIVTAVIQSSSASVGILQTIARNGLVPWNAAVYIVLGQNIGTCATALLSSVNAGKTAKRAAIIHLLFNVIGTAVFAIGTVLMFKVFMVKFGESLVNPVQISIFHTIFNVGNTILLFPFANLLVKVSKKIIPGEDIEVLTETSVTLRHLDDRILETPQFAVENAIKEVIHMGEFALKSVELSTIAYLEKDTIIAETVLDRERELNALERMIIDYLIKISNTSLSEEQIITINNLFHTANDIERIGDHAENIAELAQYCSANNLSFSQIAVDEFEKLSAVTISTIVDALIARKDMVLDAVKRVEQNEELVDTLEEEYREKHIRRLAAGVCQTTAGVVFLDVINNLERISDHALNIAQYAKDEIM
ncbi:MAG: Na/Pi cotransporter family protein [Vallitaleaceae bacterium]|jgi:phosphate:Na+ symporter|nr:Na/Pi cotransporter family protein [Vallitaleaceae bacterium]